MSNQPVNASEKVWAVIEREKKQDRLVRRLSVGGWSVTGGALVVFGVGTLVEVWRLVNLAMQGIAPWGVIFSSLMPLVAVVGGLGLLVATLSTVATFLRFRTASLSEIQMRLGAIEDMVESHLELHDD